MNEQVGLQERMTILGGKADPIGAGTYRFEGSGSVTTFAPITPNNRLAAMQFAQSLPNGSVSDLIAAATQIAAFLDGQG